MRRRIPSPCSWRRRWEKTLFRERVKIYATDVDAEALNHARQGVGMTRKPSRASRRDYLTNIVKEWMGAVMFFLKELRRAVIFGRRNLIQDAPISRVDLLIRRG